jgi:serine phosphatase RsbU (regulator of sigma subunit)
MIIDYPNTGPIYNSLLEETERQRKELTDSIKYASYIQSALLPSAELFNRLLPENFIFFKPRDVVSGDFYWISKFKNSVIVAAADCTGHGVPGAFMSMLGISFLNEIVGRGCFHSASAILNQLRERVMKTLHQTGEKKEQKDGMDIGLCIIDYDKHQLQYAGANNPVYLIRSDNLFEIKGDRMPIGINIVEERAFTNHIIDLEENDMIYLITDGYPDQFGGINERKLKYKPFKDILLRVYTLQMNEQVIILDEELRNWMGNLNQIDDILIVGFKYIRAKSK